MREAVIVGAVRTPIGKRNGSLAATHPIHLAALVIAEVAARCGIAPAEVDDVIMGCVTQTGAQGANIGRLAILYAGFPVDVPAMTINRMCGSSQQALHSAAQAIEAGDAESGTTTRFIVASSTSNCASDSTINRRTRSVPVLRILVMAVMASGSRMDRIWIGG